MRRAISALLALTLCGFGQTPREDALRRQALAIGQGYMVEVRLTTGEKLNGRLGTISERDFVLEEIRELKLQDRTIAFPDVKSLRKSDPRRRVVPLHILLATAGGVGMGFLIRAIRHR